MTAAERKLAKTFFFFSLSGLRRQYHRVEVRFIAHTTQAWEFPEAQFFEAAGSGGTAASSAFVLAQQILEEQYPSSQYNAYLFYASDGENAGEDRQPAAASLAKLSERLNYLGYIETRLGTVRFSQTDMRTLIGGLSDAGFHADTQVVADVNDVWQAIRRFFVHQAGQTADAPK
jgi:uncharacterized sporulation protein YeaH/YhbH (DUF444 family)